ncbi:hypothetical protein [Puniceibacterium sp. IMCC21224]|uniref:hypothetical protein n=1 Tax=Puniceibacterium sp. IMCC21224 TaxID=1618204 RepID=UPI00064E0BB7|nr:hypothetical protein [Puniceibacterium sp. IMCC21224]KMK68683.1 hypothetical protein IMCC21224_113567 [Puniceibacterium sp. IMCC21224]
MDQKVIGTGIVALIVGFALGNVTAPRGADMDAIGSLIDDRLATSTEANTALSAGVDGLGDRLTAIETKMAEGGTSALDAISSLGGSIETAIANQSGSIGDQLAALSESIANVPAAPPAPKAEAAPENTQEAPEPESAESASTADDAPEAEGFSVGQTALFDDGKTRVFVSGISADGASARVALNGLTLESVTAGQSLPVGDDSGCSVTIDSISQGRVALGYGCDS